jgi:hypothetical protein
MRSRLAILALLALVGCGDDDAPTKPTDPNEALYGSYIGSLWSQDASGSYQDSLHITLGKDANGHTIRLSMSGTLWPATLDSIADPSLKFSATVFGDLDLAFRGARQGNLLQGTMTGEEGLAGTWIVSK